MASPHHYEELRAIVDDVPEDILRMTPAQVADLVKADPTRVLSFVGAPASATD